jgi:hypothetical protein
MSIDAKLYIQNTDIIIDEKSFESVFEQFAINNTLNMNLFNNIKNNWLSFIEENKTKKPIFNVSLPQRILNYFPENTKNSGLYSIFSQHPNFPAPICFYVGMSAKSEYLKNKSSIRKRLEKHFYDDVNPKHKKYKLEGFGKIFCWLRECSQIFVCYAILTKFCAEKEFEKKLKFSECCLDAILRPLFTYREILNKK